MNDVLTTMNRDERFRATVYAMNTLLQQKGVYTPQEFGTLFLEHARNFAKKGKRHGRV